MHQRRFPANEITLDNYKWAVRKAARWTELRWVIPFLALCRDLRTNIPVE